MKLKKYHIKATNYIIHDQDSHFLKSVYPLIISMKTDTYLEFPLSNIISSFDAVLLSLLLQI